MLGSNSTLRRDPRAPWQCCGRAALCVAMTLPTITLAGPEADTPAPGAAAVYALLPAPPPGVAELRFSEMFERPVGPRGLRASGQLLALDGKPVRIVGYMAAAGLPTAGRLVLTPLPVELGDEDEHLADDLPPNVVFVHLSGPAAEQVLPNYHGLLHLTGRLAVGPVEEPDGHVSTVRLLLDPGASAALLPRLPTRR